MPPIVIVSGPIRDVSVVLTAAVTSGPLIHSAKSFTVQPVFVSRHPEDSEAKDETFSLLTSGQTCCPTPTNEKKLPPLLAGDELLQVQSVGITFGNAFGFRGAISDQGTGGVDNNVREKGVDYGRNTETIFYNTGTTVTRTLIEFYKTQTKINSV